MLSKEVAFSLLGITTPDSTLVGVCRNYIEEYVYNCSICEAMGFKDMEEYADAYYNHLNRESRHWSHMFPHDNGLQPISYVFNKAYFNYSAAIIFSRRVRNISGLLTSGLYSKYMKAVEPHGCMFLIRPTKETLERIYGKDSEIYNKISWICEDWGD